MVQAVIRPRCSGGLVSLPEASSHGYHAAGGRPKVARTWAAPVPSHRARARPDRSPLARAVQPGARASRVVLRARQGIAVTVVTSSAGCRDGDASCPAGVPRSLLRPAVLRRRASVGATRHVRPPRGHPRRRAGPIVQCRSASSRHAPRTGQARQTAMAAAASRRAASAAVLTGNHSSGSRVPSAHRAFLVTSARSARLVSCADGPRSPGGPMRCLTPQPP
jgi:hypothetical protein